MRVSCLLPLALLVLVLVAPSQPRRGRSSWGARHSGRTDRTKGVGRQGRAGSPRREASACSEFSESGEVFLDCQERHLASVPKTLTWTQEPHHLMLARNRIKVLRDGAFSGFLGLRSLDLQQNHLTLVEEAAFAGLTRLTTLLLQHNRLSVLAEEALIPLPTLHRLRLHDNPWSCRCPLHSLVTTLQLPSNRHLGSHARCAEPVRQRGRRLKQVDAEQLCEEEEPDLNAGPDRHTTNSSDPIGPAPIHARPDATTACHTYLFPSARLDCRSRGLTEVPVDIPQDIVHMDLSHNAIQRLRGRDFLEARGLRTLNLSSNNLEHINTASLSGLLHLRELDLSNNNLRSLQYGVLEHLYFLSLLKLGGNPWVCDYSIHYMVYWLQLHPRVSHAGLLCHTPPELRGRRVEDYVHAYNRGCPKDRDRDQNQEHTDPELWNTPMELQARLEEEAEPLRALRKYQIIRLN